MQPVTLSTRANDSGRLVKCTNASKLLTGIWGSINMCLHAGVCLTVDILGVFSMNVFSLWFVAVEWNSNECPAVDTSHLHL